MPRIVVVLCLIVGGLAFASPALASDQGPDTFVGVGCHFSGSVKYAPQEPLEAVTQVTPEFVRATGSCTSGTFDGVPLTPNDTLEYESQSSGPLSCLAGGTTEGQGTIKFRGGKLNFGLVEKRAPGVTTTFTLTGALGGFAEALGVAAFHNAEPPVRMCSRSATQQQGENGIHLVPLDFTLQTEPLISG